MTQLLQQFKASRTDQRRTPPLEFFDDSTAGQLRAKLVDRTATVAIVGLGYVGLPLAGAMHTAGFQVLGFDRDEAKIDKLGAGETYLHHLGDDLAADLAASARFEATNDPAALAQADAIILCVPSPLGNHNEPDLSFIIESTTIVADSLRPGQLISLESTTYPGTTREECLPILESEGLTCGEDFFLAFSPEREDPGRKDQNTTTIPKLVGGIEATSTELAAILYGAAVDQVVPVESTEIAESAKLLENIYRAVNIALVNELKPLLHDMGIDIFKVVDAAATKPFGFQAFYPGPGLGGHCIPIDPFYLTWKAKEYGRNTRFIELAGEINSEMPRYVVQRTTEGLNQLGKAVHGSKILVLGIAYKPNIDDVRETPAAEIIERLADLGADVTYHDPHVARFPRMRKHRIELESVALSAETLREADCVVIATDHDAVDWPLVGECAELIIDTRNAMHRVEAPRAAICPA